jgi:DNA-binding response OmpR family regulator
MTRILVVEDESDVRELLVEFLRDAGFDVTEASTADAAIPLLELDDIRILVTDINMPGRLDGIDLACAARQRCPRIPVIFMSGRPAKLAESRRMDHPAAFLQKPFSFGTLVGNIERLMCPA